MPRKLDKELKKLKITEEDAITILRKVKFKRKATKSNRGYAAGKR